MLYTISPSGYRVISTDSTGFLADGRKASPRYVAISPDRTKEQLEAEGFEVTMSFPRYRNRPMRRTVMTVSEPTAGDYSPNDYVGCASLCFDHQGKMTLRGQPGALRIGCDNEFYAAPMRIHHCSETAAAFVANPVPFVERLIELGHWIPKRIESLRGGRQGVSHRMLGWLESKRPRLALRVERMIPQYVREDGSSPWTFIQAVTNAQHFAVRRSPQLDTLVTNLLTVGYDAFCRGHDPVGDALLTVKPQLFDFVSALN
jgi:hypothetical protein